MQFDEMIPLYINGSLDDRDKVKLIMHIASCRSCREDYLLLKQMSNKVTVKMPVIPAEMSAEIYASIVLSIPDDITVSMKKQLYDSLLCNPFDLIGKLYSLFLYPITKSLSLLI
jgi:hypothetical protein